MDPKETEKTKSRLELAQEKRAKRQEEIKKQEDEQKAIDLEAIDDLERSQGDSNIAVVWFPFVPGLPMAVAVRCPKDAEAKRFQSRIKPNKDGVVESADAIEAAKELAAVTVVYPDKDTFKRVCEARPGAAVQMGTVALGLTQGEAEKKGKR